MPIIALQVEMDDGDWGTLNRQQCAAANVEAVRKELAAVGDQWRANYLPTARLRVEEVEDPWTRR